MNPYRSRLSAVVLTVLLSAVAAELRAADSPVSTAKPPDRNEPRRPFRDMSPEEREARFREMQQKFGPPPFTIEELRRMTPEERQAKLRQWRQRGFTVEERQKRRGQIKQRLATQIAELKNRKAALNEEEKLRLERLEMIATRFDRLSRPVTNAFGTPPSLPKKSK